MTPEFWRGRRVFVTGHTGFKGAWLCALLRALGAEVTGFSLDPPATGSAFAQCGIAADLRADHRGDICDGPRLAQAMAGAAPELVLHLAAQALVRDSYARPVETFATNVMGTAQLLEAVRVTPSVRAVVVVTTDKCYENREWVHPYRETDPLGGTDPYAASKACTELVAGAYRASFLSRAEPAVALATARAGNVIGGGDWAADRLVPDCIRAFAAGVPVVLRAPEAVRPWQHVLDALSGYLVLAAQLLDPATAAKAASGWNFGPDPGGELTVLEIATAVAGIWGAGAQVVVQRDATAPHEAHLLRLDSTKARVLLGWQPRWTAPEALTRTVAWYDSWHRGGDTRAFMQGQIADYLGLWGG